MGKNLLRGGAFETNYDGWYPLSLDVPAIVTTGTIYEGYGCLQIVAMTVDSYLAYGYSATDQANFAKYWGIPVVAGGTYSWSIWGWYNIDVSGAYLNLGCNWYDANGGFLSDAGVGSNFYIGTTWARAARTFVAPANAAFALPFLRRRGDSQAGHGTRFDAAQFEAGALTDFTRNSLEPISGLTCPDYGYVFRNLLMGAGTDIIVENQDGIHTMPAVRNVGVERSNDHGSIPAYTFNSDRIVAFDLKVKGDYGADIWQKVSYLRKIFQAQATRIGRTEEPLYFKRPGQPVKYALVRCTRRDLPSNYMTATGLATASIELQATDPRIYSAVGSTGTITANAGATAATQVAMLMAGDHADGAFPTLVINGPSTDAIVGNATDDNRQLKLQIALAAGHKVRVNMKTQKVEKDVGAGYVEDYTIIKNDSQWWKLRPGVNQITYNRAAGNTGLSSSVDLSWNDTWA